MHDVALRLVHRRCVRIWKLHQHADAKDILENSERNDEIKRLLGSMLEGHGGQLQCSMLGIFLD
jgi:hypothetical protein